MQIQQQNLVYVFQCSAVLYLYRNLASPFMLPPFPQKQK